MRKETKLQRMPRFYSQGGQIRSLTKLTKEIACVQRPKARNPNFFQPSSLLDQLYITLIHNRLFRLLLDNRNDNGNDHHNNDDEN